MLEVLATALATPTNNNNVRPTKKNPKDPDMIFVAEERKEREE